MITRSKEHQSKSERYQMLFTDDQDHLSSVTSSGEECLWTFRRAGWGEVVLAICTRVDITLQVSLTVLIAEWITTSHVKCVYTSGRCTLGPHLQFRTENLMHGSTSLRAKPFHQVSLYQALCTWSPWTIHLCVVQLILQVSSGGRDLKYFLWLA